MKNRLCVWCILLLCVALLCACDGNESPDTDAPADVFASVRESGETWLSYGLSAYEEGRAPAKLGAFFSERDHMTYLTLYDHMFSFDKEKSVSVAEALFAFIYENYGADALLDLEKRCAYKTAYLASLGITEEYGQTDAVERFFVDEMDFSFNRVYKYIISFDNVTYYFKDFTVGTPQQFHSFLYFNTTGLREMIAYMRENGFDKGLDTEREFNYYMTFDGSGYSKTVYENGNMVINDSYSALHEACHAMGITEKDNIWLSEGLCNYFGKALGFNDQIAASYIQVISMANAGVFDERAEAGDVSAIRYKAVAKAYAEYGGSLASVDAFDLSLFAHLAARTELALGGYPTLGTAYAAVNREECTAIGAELSYDGATSLILYLSDTYGMARVLDAYASQNMEEAFGKDYAAIKAEWLGFLQEY